MCQWRFIAFAVHAVTAISSHASPGEMSKGHRHWGPREWRSPTVERRQQRLIRNNPSLPNVRNSPNGNVSARESWTRQAQKDHPAPTEAPMEIPDEKKNSMAPIPSPPTAMPVVITVAPTLAPSSRPSTFFAPPTTKVPSPHPTTTILLPNRTTLPTVTLTPAAAHRPPVSMAAPPLSPPSQEESNAVSPPNDDGMVPSHDLSASATLGVVLGTAVASLLLSVWVLKTRHRHVQKNGVTVRHSRRRRSAKRETREDQTVPPTGMIEIPSTTMETPEGVAAAASTASDFHNAL